MQATESVSRYVDYLQSLSKKQLMVMLARARKEETQGIGIIGMGCRFPGGIDSPQRFWELLRDRGTLPTSDVGVPHDSLGQPRWNLDAADLKTLSPLLRSGSYLEDIDRFDAEYFGISVEEATYMDPHQRVLLEVAVDRGPRAPPRRRPGDAPRLGPQGRRSDLSGLDIAHERVDEATHFDLDEWTQELTAIGLLRIARADLASPPRASPRDRARAHQSDARSRRGRRGAPEDVTRGVGRGVSRRSRPRSLWTARSGRASLLAMASIETFLAELDAENQAALGRIGAARRASRPRK